MVGSASIIIMIAIINFTIICMMIIIIFGITKTFQEGFSYGQLRQQARCCILCLCTHGQPVMTMMRMIKVMIMTTTTTMMIMTTIYAQ